jgi:hypothetical protein
LVPISKASQDTGAAPILSELLTESQKTLARATRTPMRQMAAGYAINPNLGLGMTFIDWFNAWGAKFDAGITIMESVRRAGVNASLLRSLNRFSMFDGGLETHLYAFTGLGYTWQRIQEDGLIVNRILMPGHLYETPEKVGRWQLGAGTEVSFPGLGGIKFVPEVGMQVSNYLSRFQDSPTWQTQNPSSSLPKSAFELDAYYAFHLNFYFR